MLTYVAYFYAATNCDKLSGLVLLVEYRIFVEGHSEEKRTVASLKIYLLDYHHLLRRHLLDFQFP